MKLKLYTHYFSAFSFDDSLYLLFCPPHQIVQRYNLCIVKYTHTHTKDIIRLHIYDRNIIFKSQSPSCTTECEIQLYIFLQNDKIFFNSKENL